MIFCAAAMSWHTAELSWISPQGVGSVLMEKPLKLAPLCAGARAEINVHEHESDRWILELFKASLNGKPDFILMDISSTF